MSTDSSATVQPVTLKDSLFLAVHFAILSIYVAIVLALTDNLLHRLLPDYQFSGRYGFGLTIFFLVGTAFTWFGRWRGWNDWRYFIIGALGVFFPLVFLSSTLRLFIADEGSMMQAYANSYCPAVEPVVVCGKAFAASVFTMSLRALPTVITAPALYWYLLFYRADKKRAAQ